MLRGRQLVITPVDERRPWSACSPARSDPAAEPPFGDTPDRFQPGALARMASVNGLAAAHPRDTHADGWRTPHRPGGTSNDMGVAALNRQRESGPCSRISCQRNGSPRKSGRSTTRCSITARLRPASHHATHQDSVTATPQQAGLVTALTDRARRAARAF